MDQTKRLSGRFKTLALASLAGFAFGALMEFAYFKSGYCKKMLGFSVLLFLDEKMQKPVKLEIIQEDEN